MISGGVWKFPFRQKSHLLEANLKLAKCRRMSLSFQPFHLYLHTPEHSDGRPYHHGQLMWC